MRVDGKGKEFKKRGQKIKHNTYIYGGAVFFVGVLLLAMACAKDTQAPAAPASETTLLAVKTAWAVEWEKTLIAARKEGKVVVYGELGTAGRDALFKPFKDKYGISLEVVSSRGAETAAKVLAERRAGLYLADLIRIGKTSMTIIKNDGGLDTIEPLLVFPEVIDPKAWYGDKGLPYYDKDHKILTVFMSSSPVAVTN